jgi:predicted nucleic acid-binding protein
MRILIDTNVLLRGVSRNAGDRILANHAVERLLQRLDEPVVVPQILYEWWVVATRPKTSNGLGLDPSKAFSALKSLESSFAILPDNVSVYNVWRQLVSVHGVSGKAAHDARLVAAMAVHGLQQILTFNGTDFKRYTHVTVIDPSNIA